jgi:uncharacterized protein (DUF2141 family)
MLQARRTAARLVPWFLCATLVLAVGTLRADPAAKKGVLSVHLVELRTSDGQVGCALHTKDAGYPTDRKAAVQTKWCTIASQQSVCTFEPIVAGTYAVACFHDENKNGVLDTGLLGIPTEGVVASNHAKGFMGPPKFRDAKFAFSGEAKELRLKMGY